MIYLILDCETNGLPPFYDLPYDEMANWPRLILVACDLYDDSGHELSHNDLMALPSAYR